MVENQVIGEGLVLDVCKGCGGENLAFEGLEGATEYCTIDCREKHDPNYKPELCE